MAILVAITVNEAGYREILSAAEGMKEDKASWVSFFQWLRGRGLDGIKLVVGDTWDAGGCGKSVPGGQLHCPILPQCILYDSSLQGEAGGQDAQGNSRPREQERCPREKAIVEDTLQEA